MRLFAAAVLLVLAVSLAQAYQLTQSREEILAYYQNNLEEKIPKSAKTLIGDERINVYVGGRQFGIETKRGELYYFETYALEKPTIVVRVSDAAFEKIIKKKTGVLQAIDDGGIKIQPKNFLSALKVETAKRVYAVSGVDDTLSGKKKGTFPTPPSAPAYNSLYVQKARIAN